MYIIIMYILYIRTGIYVEMFIVICRYIATIYSLSTLEIFSVSSKIK